MRKFGLIGYPLGHSFSKTYFGDKFTKEEITGCSYENYPIDNIKGVQALIESDEELVGLNVTIPYKEQVIAYLSEIDDEAKEIGAVNTIKILRSKDGVLIKGFNTDVYGFEQPLLPVIQKKDGLSALILGTGGAAKAVAWVLRKNNIAYSFVSRKQSGANILSYENLDKKIIEGSKLIINTSPVGMYPNINVAPDINYDAISAEHVLYDLIYNPEQTLFLKNGAKKKAITLNGLPMLRLQAEKAWEIWNS